MTELELSGHIPHFTVIILTMSKPSVNLSGFCKHCGFEFKSIRNHLQFSPKCKVKYGTECNPEYILSGPCWSCGKVFKQIAKHLSRAPKCIAAYDSTELEEAKKHARRVWSKSYYEANRNKIKQYERQHYEDKREYILAKTKEYHYENKDRLKAVKKWKLTSNE